MGIYIAFFFLVSFARDNIHLSYTASLDLLLVITGVGSIGRLVPNHFADRVGAITVSVVVTAYTGVVALCWTAVRDTPGLYAWCCFYGLGAGGIQSLFPAGLTSLTSDLRKAGVRMGMTFTIVSFATLAGPPIAGAIVQSQGGRYTGAQVFAGVCMLMGAGFMAAARVVKVRKLGLGWKAKV
jgi:MFS family permease